MSKHTPGPWTTHDVHPDVWTRQVWTDECHGSVMIATTGGVDKEPNARLIAKAPEMLALLRRLVHPMASDEDVEDARALLATFECAR